MFLSICLKHLADINTILYLSVGQIPFPFCIKSPIPTSWSRIPLEKLTMAHLIKPLSCFHDTEGSLPLTQKPTIGPYPKIDGYNPRPSISTSCFNILPSTPRSWRLSAYFGFSKKLCVPLSSAMRVTFPAKFILDLNILIMYNKGHRSWSFTFCKFSCLLVHFRFMSILFFNLFFSFFLLWHFTFVLLPCFPSYFWSCVSFLRHASTSRPVTLNHSCFWLHHWAHQQKNSDITGYCAWAQL